MLDLFHRLAVVLLFTAGLATLAGIAAAGAPTSLAQQHQQALVALTGAALLAAAWWPSLRMPALAAALLSKLALLALAAAGPAAEPALAPLAGEALQVVLLAVAGAILLHEARLEARWMMEG